VILVGCGNRGVNAHGKLAAASDTLRLVAVCDVDEARMRAASAQLGVPGERDLGALLGREDVQAAIVATSAKWHVPVALDAIRAGKHVLVEKPLADTAAAAKELARAAEAAGVVGIVGYQWRLNDFTAAIAREAAATEPMQALVTRQRGPFRQQFFFPEHYGGIMDHMAHDIHLALLLMGGVPTGVYASVTRGLILRDETLEFANVLIEFEGGRRSATVVGSMHGIRTPNVVQVVGTRGSVTTTDRRTLQIVRHAGITEPLPAQPADLETTTVETRGEGGDATGAMLDHFADLIAGRATEQRGTTLWEGMHAVAVMEAAVEAARSGRRMPIDLG
jgi:predicted dehydrogenase